jgi:hypothetical protein
VAIALSKIQQRERCWAKQGSTFPIVFADYQNSALATERKIRKNRASESQIDQYQIRVTGSRDKVGSAKTQRLVDQSIPKLRLDEGWLRTTAVVRVGVWYDLFIGARDLDGRQMTQRNGTSKMRTDIGEEVHLSSCRDFCLNVFRCGVVARKGSKWLILWRRPQNLQPRPESEGSLIKNN